MAWRMHGSGVAGILKLAWQLASSSIDASNGVAAGVGWLALAKAHAAWRRGVSRERRRRGYLGCIPDAEEMTEEIRVIISAMWLVSCLAIAVYFNHLKSLFQSSIQ